MSLLNRKLPRFVGAGAIAAMLTGFGVITVAAAPADATCSGGNVAPGTYASLTIAGFCQLAGGNVTVLGNVVIQPGGGLLAAFASSNLSVGHDVLVESGALLLLGCEPNAFPCFDDPTLSTSDSVANDLTATGATLVIAHHNTIGGSLAQSGGGGGLTCAPLFPNGPPPYSTYEDNIVHGDATIAGLKTCWLGFIRNTVWGSANLNNNSTLDPDGNEFITNTVHGHLNCFHNNPAAQLGDSGGTPNVVFGTARGQCSTISVGPS